MKVIGFLLTDAQGLAHQDKLMALVNMYKLLLVAGAVLMAGSACADDEPGHGDLVGTHAGWEIAIQMSDYHYAEPDLDVAIWGPRLGMSAAYTHTRPNNWFVKVDGRIGYGLLEYEGSGMQDSVPDLVFETRGTFGRDFFPRHNISLSPYAGVGYRYLYNDLRGITTTGHAGYRRYSRYFYIPVGLTSRFNVSGKWSVLPTIEYDYFITGRQESRLSDTGPSLGDAYNEQSNGYGYRASVMLEKGAWAFGPWLHFWHIEDSDIVSIGFGLGGMEPENETREYGLELKYRF
jgi:hypothetical protein